MSTCVSPKRRPRGDQKLTNLVSDTRHPSVALAPAPTPSLGLRVRRQKAVVSLHAAASLRVTASSHPGCPESERLRLRDLGSGSRVPP